MRHAVLAFVLLLSISSSAQKRDRFTLYDGHSGAPKRIKEGKYIDIDIKTDKCPGWETHDHSVGGELLIVEDSSVTIVLWEEYVHCADGDSTFDIMRTDLPKGTMTIRNDRIFSIDRGEPVAGNVFGVIMGVSAATLFFIAPIASISWFNGGEFNTDRYTSMTTISAITMGVSFPLYAAFSGSTPLVPQGHAVR